jgi:glucose-1-phosphate adenylyltransferase
VFGADHIYRMDPRQMVQQHLDTQAGVTVAAIPVPVAEAREFGVIEANAEGRIVAFHEKVDNPPTMADRPGYCLASMGNYIFDTKTLVDIVTPKNGKSDAMSDIGGDVIPALTDAGVAYVYDFSNNIVPGDEVHNRGYWRDVGSIDTYYDANMDLIMPVPQFNLYNQEWPVYSNHPPLPPAKVSRGSAGEMANVHASLLCQGSIISGGHVEQSVLGTQAYVDHDAHVTESILFPQVRVEPGARLRRCIVDKNVVVPAGMRIGFDEEFDRNNFTVSDNGVVVIEKDRDLTLLR